SAEAGLGQIESDCRPAKTAPFDDRDKIRQLLEIHR
ncbi:MAG: hypothetical protein RL707_1029, partial [Pseudomonadota bacterium]